MDQSNQSVPSVQSIDETELSDTYQTKVVFKVMNFVDRLDTEWTQLTELRSDVFTIGSTDWRIKVKCKDQDIGLYLYLAKANQMPVKTKFKIYIIDGQQKQQFFGKLDHIEYTYTMCTGTGIKSMTDKQVLADNQQLYLPDNNLTVGFDITVYRSQNCDQSHGGKRRRLNQLMANKALNNFSFIVGKDKRRFFVDKLQLSCQSVVFEKMFTTETKESKLESIIIEDIDSEVFEQFLQFVYTGMCDKLETMSDKLLDVANKFLVTSLKTICLNLIFMKITEKTALSTLQLMEKYEANDDLKTKVVDYIVANTGSLIGHQLDRLGIDSVNRSQVVDRINKLQQQSQTRLLVYTYRY